MGCELEYFLVRRRQDGSIELADPLDKLDQPCYDMRALTRSLGFVTDVARHVNALGWDIYATDHEDANGQFEQNFQFDDALVSCDRAVFFRYMVESLAQERGLMATFMPKPFAHLTGNGCHMHMSLWDGDRPLFQIDPADDPRGLGLTEGGLPLHRRPDGARQGLHRGDRADRELLQAPARSATRAPAPPGRRPTSPTATTTARRCCACRRPGRVEDRTVDGSCNPYLAATVLLAAGLDGIERELDPGDPNALNLYETTAAQRQELGIDTLPENLLDATRELERDDVIRKALGTTPQGRLRRLLRRVQAPRGAGRPRADHAVGARPLPAALLAPMCGIVGLFAKSPEVEERLGALLGAMLAQMADRGPDSAGLALYRDPAPAGATKLTLFSADPGGLGGGRPRARPGRRRLRCTPPTPCSCVDADAADGAGARARAPAGPARDERRRADRDLQGDGRPARVRGALRAGGDERLARARPHAHGDGEPRDHAGARIPFSTGLDLCLVHNGSLSNHNQLRRRAAARGDRLPDGERHGGGGRLPDVAAARGRHRWTRRCDGCLRDLDGFYTFAVGTADGFAVLRDPIACKPAVLAETDDWVAMASEYRAIAVLPGAEDAAVWEPEPARVYSWERARSDAGRWPRRSRSSTSPRRRCASSTGGCTRADVAPRWRVVHPGGAHAVAVGIDAEIEVDVDGHVGYYCAGMNQRATVRVHGNAGVGLAENIMSGTVVVDGYAGQSCAATGRGGLVVVRGDASARCGISMKGVDIVVPGDVGHMSAFMAQTGALVVCGDAGEALGDSLYEARLYVRGSVASLGADCVEKELRDEHVAELRRAARRAGLADADPADFRRYGSARRLYTFEVDDAGD